MTTSPENVGLPTQQDADQAVADYVAGTGQFAEPDTPEESLAVDISSGTSLSPREVGRVRAKMDSQALADQEKQQAALEKQQAQADALYRKEQEIEAARNDKFLRKVGSKLSDGTQAIHDKVVSAPMPEHGIGILLGVIIFFLWAAVPVNEKGQTRLELLFYTIMGRTQLNYPGANPLYGGGSSGNFGGSTAGGIVPVPKTLPPGGFGGGSSGNFGGEKKGGASTIAIDPGKANYIGGIQPTEDFSIGG